VLPARGRPASSESLALARAVAQAGFHLPLLAAVATSVPALACEVPGFLTDAWSKVTEVQRTDALDLFSCTILVKAEDPS